MSSFGGISGSLAILVVAVAVERNLCLNCNLAQWKIWWEMGVWQAIHLRKCTEAIATVIIENELILFKILIKD